MQLSSILIPAIFLTFLSCSKDMDEDLAFCNSITQGNYSESSSMINDFLKDLNYDDPRNLGDNSNMEILADWLENKSCIKDVEITCFWCYYSNPPIGCLSMVRSDNSDTLILWLIGSIPYRASDLMKNESD